MVIKTAKNYKILDLGMGIYEIRFRTIWYWSPIGILTEALQEIIKLGRSVVFVKYDGCYIVNRYLVITAKG